ncbi:hypothetical protein EHW67_05480 [Arenibacter aquaticus]|uniref:YCII-related domain-containing protein n=1 Tax=Arenibacter aquaticus TaxID=2489054 RepID=A0A430K6L2_9FLAO|nr:YciI family protein [Arenibacter aquaticus]RTE54619.1 hypothetical protein EHW67_05480 [Arenibacter aquaticus]
MEKLYTVLVCALFLSCMEATKTKVNVVEKTTSVQEIPVSQLKKELDERGFQTFDYVDEKTKDTLLMQQYFIAFLKKGPNRSSSKEEVDSLQRLHLAHLGRMYEEGFADISGPFGDDGEIRGITIYNVPNLQMADSLAKMDPMVKSGRLTIEIHPWWAAKGFKLR